MTGANTRNNHFCASGHMRSILKRVLWWWESAHMALFLLFLQMSKDILSRSGPSTLDWWTINNIWLFVETFWDIKTLDDLFVVFCVDNMMRHRSCLSCACCAILRPILRSADAYGAVFKFEYQKSLVCFLMQQVSIKIVSHCACVYGQDHFMYKTWKMIESCVQLAKHLHYETNVALTSTLLLSLQTNRVTVRVWFGVRINVRCTQSAESWDVRCIWDIETLAKHLSISIAIGSVDTLVYGGNKTDTPRQRIVVSFWCSIFVSLCGLREMTSMMSILILQRCLWCRITICVDFSRKHLFSVRERVETRTFVFEHQFSVRHLSVTELGVQLYKLNRFIERVLIGLAMSNQMRWNCW